VGRNAVELIAVKLGQGWSFLPAFESWRLTAVGTSFAGFGNHDLITFPPLAVLSSPQAQIGTSQFGCAVFFQSSAPPTRLVRRQHPSSRLPQFDCVMHKSNVRPFQEQGLVKTLQGIITVEVHRGRREVAS
jgi:hypothetical protein